MDLETGKDVIPSLLPVWWGNGREYNGCGVRQDVRRTLIRELSPREAQKETLFQLASTGAAPWTW